MTTVLSWICSPAHALSRGGTRSHRAGLSGVLWWIRGGLTSASQRQSAVGLEVLFPDPNALRAMVDPVQQPRPVSTIERWLVSATQRRRGVAEVIPLSELIGSGQHKSM
jgi:hypothetical protein